MPRKGRIDFPGALHHIIVRGINRRNIFFDRRDRREFLRRLNKGLVETGVECFSWALIPNHVHLLLKTANRPLTDLMRSLLTGYALCFNKRHQRVGYLFQNRYKSILCDEDKYFLQLVRYIHLNPLRAGLVSSLSELNRYSWCGHSAILGNQHLSWQNISAVLKRFGKTVGQARIHYLEFVSKGIPEGRRPDLSGGGLLRSAGGWVGIRQLKRAGERWRGDERILGDNDFVAKALKTVDDKLEHRSKMRLTGWTLGRLLEYVGDRYGAEVGHIVGGRRDRLTIKARTLFIGLAINELGYNLTEIAKFLKVSRSAVFQATKRGGSLVEGERLPPFRNNLTT